MNAQDNELKKVVIKVRGGIAEVDVCPEGVDVDIIDLDNLDDCCYGHVVVDPSAKTADVHERVKKILNGRAPILGYERERADEFILAIPDFNGGVYVSPVKLSRNRTAYVFSDCEIEESEAIAYIESKELKPIAKFPFEDILGFVKFNPENTFVDDIIDEVKGIIRPVATFSGKTSADNEPVLATEMFDGMRNFTRKYGVLPVVLSVPVDSEVAFVFATADVPQDVVESYVQREIG